MPSFWLCLCVFTVMSSDCDFRALRRVISELRFSNNIFEKTVRGWRGVCATRVCRISTCCVRHVESGIGA
jgi:hypothetical protein